jgi:hypothetical protein
MELVESSQNAPLEDARFLSVLEAADAAACDLGALFLAFLWPPAAGAAAAAASSV